jgi:hypothetical protein
VTLTEVDRAVAIGKPLVCPCPVVIADTGAIFVPVRVLCTLNTTLRSLAPAVTWTGQVRRAVNLRTGRMADTNERIAPILRLCVLWVDAIALQLEVLCSMFGTLIAVELSWPMAGLTEFVAFPYIRHTVISLVPLVTDANAVGVLMGVLNTVVTFVCPWAVAVSTERLTSTNVSRAVRSVCTSRSTPAIVALAILVKLIARGIRIAFNTVTVEWTGTVMHFLLACSFVGAASDVCRAIITLPVW